MKKKVWDHASGMLLPDANKILLKMKLTLCIILFSFLGAIASESYSQTTKLSLDLKNTTVKEVLGVIENQSEFFFLYSEKIIDVNRKVNIEAQGSTIEKILDRIFAGTNISYTVKGRQIVLTTPEANNFNGFSQSQQQKSVSGKVTDSSGSPLPGVSVVVKGTTTGTISDANGNYSLSNVPENATLQYSFVGMKGQEVAVGGKTTVNVSMEEDAIGIEEVVAIGYGTQKRREVIGSIATIKNELFETRRSSTNFKSLLQGQAAGVSVQSRSGDLGADAKIQIRGLSSISAGTNPLFIIDGIPVIDAAMSLINPSDIESIEVLKDAAATSIYGSRGSNGIIMVTTKTGTPGKLTVNVNFDSGISNLPLQQVEIGTSAQWFELMDLAKGYIHPNTPFDINTDLYSSMSYQTEKLTREEAINTNTDWKKVLLRQGNYRDANISVVGGDKMSRYFVSLNHRKDNGVMRNDDLERYSIRSNVDLKPLNNFSIGTKILLTLSKANSSGGSFGQILTYPFVPVYSKTNPNLYWNPLGGNPAATNDPENYDNHTDNYRAIAGAYAEYTFPFIKGLSARAETSLDFLQSNGVNYQSALIRTDGTTSASDNAATNKTSNSNVYFTFDRQLNDHSLNLVGGTEWSKSTSWSRNMTGRNLVGPFHELGTPSLLVSMSSRLSGETYRLAYFGRANYKFKEKLFAGFSIRRDAASVFTEDYRWGTFMAFSAGWIISDEPFMGDFGKNNMLKLRGSFGQTGNSNIPPKLDGAGYLTGLPYGGNDIGATNGTQLNSLGVGNLTWETTDNSDFGIDFGFNNNRINGSLAYYNKYVRDLLLAVALPPSSGVSSGTIWNNIGDIVNRGIELSVSSLNFSSKNFKWQTTFNFTYNHNEVKKLTPQIDQKGTGMLSGNQLTKVGYGIRDYFLAEFAGIDAQSGLPKIYARDPEVYKNTGETVRLKDAEGNYVLKDANSANAGSNLMHFKNKNQIPKYYGGITNSFNYKAFDFSFLVTYAGGFYVLDQELRNITMIPRAQAGLVDLYDNVWRAPGDNAKYMRILWGSNQYPDPVTGKTVSFGDSRINQSQFLFKGDYVKLKSVTLGYTLPTKSTPKKLFRELRLYAACENLYTLTNYPGWDPEGQETIGYSEWAMPQLFSASFGISVKF